MASQKLTKKILYRISQSKLQGEKENHENMETYVNFRALATSFLISAIRFRALATSFLISAIRAPFFHKAGVLQSNRFSIFNFKSSIQISYILYRVFSIDTPCGHSSIHGQSHIRPFSNLSKLYEKKV